MVSVIICSKDPAQLSAVSINVANTIGVPYEIVYIDNQEGRYGICQAYNFGAEKSQFDILCFMHEDLIFHTPDWGTAVINHLGNQSIGLIGVAGSTYCSKNNAGWWNNPEEFLRFKFYQSYPSGKLTEYHYKNPCGENLTDVVSVDGLWFCVRKEVWRQHRFDEVNFKGFHFYDLDFSLQIKGSKRVCVMYDVLIEHLSPGTINFSWIDNFFIFRQKWKPCLPMSVSSLPAEKQKEIELSIIRNFIHLMFEHKYSNKTIFKYVYMCFKIKLFDKNNLWLLRRLILGPTVSQSLYKYRRMLHHFNY
jgi:glycosyltransferase involved in cell wall biosynthesis